MLTVATTKISDTGDHNKRRVLARKHTDKGGRSYTKSQETTGTERHTDITNSEGLTRDDMSRDTGKQMDKSRAEGPKVIDFTHNKVNLAQIDKATAQSHKKNSESNDWGGEDITMITETRQQAHIHQSGGSGYIFVFPRDMQRTTAMTTATAQERGDDATWADGNNRFYVMALRRLRHYKELNGEVIDIYLSQICTQSTGTKNSCIPSLYAEIFIDDDFN